MSTKKDSGKLTFMIVPHGKSSTHSLQVSLKHLKLAGLGLATLGCLGLYLFTDYLHMNATYEDMESKAMALQAQADASRQELQKGREQFASIMDQVKEMEAYVKQLEQMEQEIRSKSGSLSLTDKTDQPDAQLTETVLASRGGPERFSLQEEVVDQELTSDQMLQQTTAHLHTLQAELPDTINKISHLQKDVEVWNEKMTHTPTIYPAVGTVTSRFGYRRDPFHGQTRFHDGFDIANHYRSPIHATASGKVVFAQRMQGHGKMIRIAHTNTLQTSYSHLTEIAVSVGQEVQKGQVIGYMGSTGRSTGVHVHYMVYENGQPVNPEKYLPEERRN